MWNVICRCVFHVDFCNIVNNNFNIMKESKTLLVRRRGGGSVIDATPVFSLDAESLYVVWGSVVRAYSVKTGEVVAEYEGLNSKAIGVKLHPTNPNAIVACNDRGKLMQWDWRLKSDGKVVKLRFNKAKNTRVTDFHLLPLNSQEDDANKCEVCVVWKYKKKDARQLSICCSKKGTLVQKFQFWLNDSRHCLAVGGKSGEQYLAGIYKNCLQFFDTTEWQKCDKQYIGGGRTFTCVACHPEKKCIATGDNSGRILLWWNILSSADPTYSVYHWHSLPCKTMVFSHAGSNFYSGGGECVLVKWNVDCATDRGFLPRLPAPICDLSLAPDNKYLAICTTDNGIRIVTSQLKLCSTVQHFTCCREERHGLPLFPAGIVFDPRTKSLVLNGRIGHIQIYSPRTKSLLYNLDITGMNYMSQERNTVIVSTDVILIAINDDGHWMATVEHRDDKESNVELRLKFWHFDDEMQTFCLNTSVEYPHNGRIVAIAFQPSQDPLQQLAVTTGTDLKFRTWSLTESASIYRMGALVWKCESVGFYRNLPAGDLSFSMDGSVLAIAFGATLTVWVPETNELKCDLTPPPRSEKHIKHVEFGRADCCHLVVTSTEQSINVWNLLTLKMLWTVPLHVDILVSDPCSEFMAVFTTKNTLFVFTPKTSKPTYTHKEVVSSKTKIMCAAFIPYSDTEKTQCVSWQENSQLYFLDSHQELLVLEGDAQNRTKEEGLILPISTLETVTPFRLLLAKKELSDVEKLQVDTEQQLGVPGATAIKELLSAPAHTMPPVNLLCGPFLRSLVNSSIKSGKEEREKIEDGKTDRLDTEDSGVDSGDEWSGAEAVKKSFHSPVTKHKTKNVPNMNTADYESRLADILKGKMDWANLLFQ